MAAADSKAETFMIGTPLDTDKLSDKMSVAGSSVGDISGSRTGQPTDSGEHRASRSLTRENSYGPVRPRSCCQE
eukprot:67024-Karenia_brevis.AAC.1